MNNIRDDIRKHGPWRAKTWWGKRTAAVNVAIVVVVFLIILWTALFP